MIINITKTIPATWYYAEVDTDELNLTEEQLEEIKDDPNSIMEYIENPDDLDWEEDQFCDFYDLEYDCEIKI